MFQYINNTDIYASNFMPLIYIKMKSDWQMYDTKEREVLPGKKRGSVVYVRKVNGVLRTEKRNM